MQGQATTLPSLKNSRMHHACGTIKKSDGATVREGFISLNFCMIQCVSICLKVGKPPLVFFSFFADHVECLLLY